MRGKKNSRSSSSNNNKPQLNKKNKKQKKTRKNIITTEPIPFIFCFETSCRLRYNNYICFMMMNIITTTHIIIITRNYQILLSAGDDDVSNMDWDCGKCLSCDLQQLRGQTLVNITYILLISYLILFFSLFSAIQ